MSIAGKIAEFLAGEADYDPLALLREAKAELAIVKEVKAPKRGLLFDSQWVNIVNHDRSYHGYSVEDAVHTAVKLTEQAISSNFDAARISGDLCVSAPAAQGEGCQTCEPDGIYATDGTGPWDCYACGKKAAAPAVVVDGAWCATDQEISEWLERHDLARALPGSDARAAFEDARSAHMLAALKQGVDRG